MALRNSSRTTMNITKKQSQIESSPNPRQNLLGLETKSSNLIPLLVLIIRITPIALVASNLSSSPEDSAYTNPEYQIPMTANNQIGAPREWARNSSRSGTRIPLVPASSAINSHVRPSLFNLLSNARENTANRFPESCLLGQLMPQGVLIGE